MKTRTAQWERVKELFHASLNILPDKREAFLTGACNDDTELHEDVRSLLAAHDEAAAFLEQPAFRSWTSPDMSPEGHMVGPYRLVREIGRGGMGVVYVAQRNDGEFRQQVALKFVKRGMDTELILRRFRAERQILAGLDHPHIARLLDGGTTAAGLPFFVMEYIEGEPIDRYCTSHGLSVRERLALFRHVCAAVHFAHQRLVVHRDLKPANIVVTAQGIPKLLDFGIAKLLRDNPDGETAVPTAIALRPMTPDYASPEQLSGEAVTTLSDVYSLGVVLFELLAGEHPFRMLGAAGGVIGGAIGAIQAVQSRPTSRLASAVFARAAAQRANNGNGRVAHESAPSRADRERERVLRGDLDNILLRAMHADPVRRYPSAEALSDDIRRHLAGLPVEARPDTVAYLVGKFVRRNRLGVATAALALATLAGAAIVAGREAHIASIERARAERRFDDVRRLATSFLFELHDAIRDLPGSTRARELLARRALVSLDALSHEAIGDPSLQRDLAAAYIKIGDVLGLPYAPNLGQTAAALASYKKALALLSALVPNSPRDVTLSRDLSVAHQRIGRVELRAGALTSAIASERRAVALSETLVTNAPDDAALRQVLSENYLFLGRAVYGTRTLANSREALSLFDRSLAIRESLLSSAPGDAALRTAVAQSLESAGYAYWHIGDNSHDTASYRAALASLRRAHEMRRLLLVSDPGNARARRAVPDGEREIAQLQAILGDVQGAATSFRDGLAAFAALAAQDTSNAELHTDIALAHQGLGEALIRLRHVADGTTHLRAAVSIFQRIYAGDRANDENHQYLIKAQKALDGVAPRRAPAPIASPPSAG